MMEHKVRTNRLLLIDKAIRTGKYPNTDRLAALAEVNPRTVQWDIECMRDMYGASLEYDRVRRGYRTPYTIELFFNREIGAYALDRQWHSTQTVQSNDDGSVRVKFTTIQMPEVFRWVMGQGRTMKALGPAELIEQVKAECVRVRGMYE